MRVRDRIPTAREHLLAGRRNKAGRRRRPTVRGRSGRNESPSSTGRTRGGAVMPDQHGPESHPPGRSHVALQAMRSRVQPGSFPLLLVTLLLLYVLNGVAVDLPANAIVGRVAVTCAGQTGRAAC